MAIIEVVRGDGPRVPRHLTVRLGWLAAIWIVITAVFLVAAFMLYLLDLLVPK